MYEQEWWINLECKKCGRFSGTIVRGKTNGEKVVGCKNCGASTTINLVENQQVKIADLVITSGKHYYYDS